MITCSVCGNSGTAPDFSLTHTCISRNSLEQENKELKEEIDYLNKSRDAWELVAVVGQSRYEKHQQIIRDLRAENNALAQEIEALTDEMASGTEEMEIANSALREAMRTINQLRATVGELTRSVEGYPDQSSN